MLGTCALCRYSALLHQFTLDQANTSYSVLFLISKMPFLDPKMSIVGSQCQPRIYPEICTRMYMYKNVYVQCYRCRALLLILYTFCTDFVVTLPYTPHVSYRVYKMYHIVWYHATSYKRHRDN